MENQHQKIKGYRDLSNEEIFLMNEIKEHGVKLESLIEKLRKYGNSQHNEAKNHGVETEDWTETTRLCRAKPLRWVSLGEDHLQQGLMALTRAVAQTTTF